MAAWREDELDRIGDVQELQLASARKDGSLRPYTIMWVVRVGDETYVRSAGGRDRPWYRRATASRAGRIRAGGVERDVTFGEATAGAYAAIDAAYHAKYDQYGASIVGHVVGPAAEAVTVRLVPRNDESNHGRQRRSSEEPRWAVLGWCFDPKVTDPELIEYFATREAPITRR